MPVALFQKSKIMVRRGGATLILLSHTSPKRKKIKGVATAGRCFNSSLALRDGSAGKVSLINTGAHANVYVR